MKIRLTLTTEYEVNKSFYPEGATPQEILDIDISLVQDDEKNFLDLAYDFKVKGEIIE